MIEPRINEPCAHPIRRLAPARHEIKEILAVFGGPEHEGRSQEHRRLDGSFRQLRIVAVIQHQRFRMQRVIADAGLPWKRFHHGLPRCLGGKVEHGTYQPKYEAGPLVAMPGPHRRAAPSRMQSAATYPASRRTGSDWQ